MTPQVGEPTRHDAVDVTCTICRAVAASIGGLCDSCGREIMAPVAMLPEQVVATAVHPTTDALIDQWGRAHFLDDRTLIGRVTSPPGIRVIHASVSRQHAHLARGPEGWRVRDLASMNGTFVNDEPVDSAVVAHGDRISMGSIAFYLAIGVGAIPVPSLDASMIKTHRCVKLEAEDAEEGSFQQRKPIPDQLPSLDVRVAEALAGSGGNINVGGISTQLSANQMRLVALLARRMLEEMQQPPHVRGFVRSSDLIAALQWDSTDPDDNRLKQLVRRTRWKLASAGLGDLIEARQRFGYRLHVHPHE